MKSLVALVALVAFAALAWWLHQQIAISRRVEVSTLDRLRKLLAQEAA